jgi:tetratricopeptide (TPR) repeat protein
LVARDKFDEAISLFRTALKAEPNREDYIEHLGDALVEAGEIDAGITALKRAIVLNPTSVDLHSKLAAALGKKGDLIGEETEYSAACNLLNNLHKNDPLYSKIETDPALSARFAHLARVQIEHGKYPEADATLNRAIQADPQNYYAYLLRGRLLERKNQSKEAEVQRQRAKDLLAETIKREKDNFPGIASSQPLIWFVLPYEDFQEIVRLYKSLAVPLMTPDRVILSAVYLEMGQTENAVAELNQLVINQEYDDARFHFGIAEVFKKAKPLEKAEEYYRKAYEMDPENVTYAYEYEAIRQSSLSRR